jgi:predicted Zn-dependent protease
MKNIWIILIGVGIVIGLIFLGLYKNRQKNPITGKRQYVNLSPEEEVKFAFNAAPELARQLGGLTDNMVLRDSVKSVGLRLVQMSSRDLQPYAFDFHLLADPHTSQMLGLPGGQVFLTTGLLKKLQSVNQLAAVLSHAIGHVVGRHATEKMATKGFLKGLLGPGGSVAGNDTEAGIRNFVKEMTDLIYDDSEELESDELAIRMMTDAGYNPEGLIEHVQLLNRGLTPFGKMHPKSPNYEKILRDKVQEFRDK